METKVTHSLSLDKIRSVVSSALVKFYGSGDPERLKIYQGGNRLNFCCPYCGDSDKYKNKTRKQIAEHYKCSEVLIKQRLKEFGIKKKTKIMEN